MVVFSERKNKSNIINAANGDPEGRPVAQSGWFEHLFSNLTFDNLLFANKNTVTAQKSATYHI